jgi:hypothetical protein
MLRDESGNGGGRPKAPKNVLGDRLKDCSMKPMTGSSETDAAIRVERTSVAIPSASS